MGRILAGEVLKVREKIITTNSLKVCAENITFKADVRQPSFEDVKKAEEIIHATPEKPAIDWGDEDNWDVLQLERVFAKALLDVYKSEQKSIDMDLQVIKLGELHVCGIPCELFTEFGLEIKKKSFSKYNMINTLANGQYGYIAVEEAFKQGGYETRITNSTRFLPATGLQIVDNTIRLIKKLNNPI
jgi:hypothetical protein